MLTFAHIVLAACALASAGAWARRAHDRPLWFGIWAVASIAVGVGAYELLPEIRLWQLATPLREGGTLFNTETILGFTPSNGPNFRLYVRWVAEPFVPPLIAIVRGNIALTCACAVALGALATRVYRAWWAPFLVVAICWTTPLLGISAVGELAGPLIGTYFLLGAVCVAAATMDAAKGRPGVRIRGAAGVTAAAWLAAQTRLEMATIGLPAVVVAWGFAIAGTERALGLSERVNKALRSALERVGSRRFAPLLVVALAAASVRLFWYIPRPNFRSAALGLSPFDPSVLTFPLAIGPVVTVGTVLLAILGLVRLGRDWARFGLLPLGFLVLYKVHFASAHNGEANFEMLRYQTFWVVPLGFIAVWGGPELGRLFARTLRETHQRLAWGLLVVALFTMWPGPASHVVDRSRTLHTVGTREVRGGWAGYDVQQEILFVAHALDDYPTCAILAPYARRSTRFETDPDVPFELRGYVALTTTRRGRYQSRAVRPGDLGDYLSEHSGECVLYYEGLDCHIIGVPICPQRPDGAEVLTRHRFRSRHWGEPGEWGPYDGDIDLTLYGLPTGPIPPTSKPD
jgi:hypothetical protein